MDGISLTVNEVRGRHFRREHHPAHRRGDQLRHLQPGDPVNIEIDMLARYVARLPNHRWQHELPAGACRDGVMENLMQNFVTTELSYLSSAEELIEEARNGRMFILVDDEDRENEGDLVIPAQFATPDAINFMARHARGLICLAMTRQRVESLGLPLMSRQTARGIRPHSPSRSRRARA